MPLPECHFRIVNCQAATNWIFRTGSNIGGVAPASYGMTQGVFGHPLAALLHTQSAATNPGYADWLAGGVFNLPPICTGHLQLGLTFFVSSVSVIQAIEIDTKITDANQVTFDGSLQFDYSQSETLTFVQVDKKGGGWVNTGISVDKFAPNVEHTVLIEYEFNSVAKTHSVVSITIDGVFYALPASLQNLPDVAYNPPWKASEILPQLQQDTKPIASASWNWLITDMFYNIW